MKNDNIMIQIRNVSKRYVLGQIGGTTLREEYQRLRARLHHEEDPTRKIGDKAYNKGDIFCALDNVSFEVKQGERVGIIGHNGAGKSTLLKLISRVTAPSSGFIGLNGRVASMLEVGTGFHPELTGRENIYMNGAILGMTRKEIDSKLENIIDFSECRQFIDTPVKRYSSGMYVKLAFSVAAHLDSEIMIMDEVLAVGDLAFQQKCLEKMKAVSMQDSRTILYVSHNMNTIRELCDRCIVMSHGKVIYDGDVDQAIMLYSNASDEMKPRIDLTKEERIIQNIGKPVVKMKTLEVVDSVSTYYKSSDKLKLKLTWEANDSFQNAWIRAVFRYSDSDNIGVSLSDSCVSGEKGKNYETILEYDLSLFTSGKYRIGLYFSEIDASGQISNYDAVRNAFYFEVSNKSIPISWRHRSWGHLYFPNSMCQTAKLGK